MQEEVMRRSSALILVATLLAVTSTSAQTPPAAPIPAGADGAKIFAITCAGCHLVNGVGTEGKVPPLAGSEWVTGNENRLIRIVLHGLTGDVEVQGEVFNGAMPTWGGAFSDEQIASVLTFVRRSWGNKAPPVTVDAVAKVRQLYLTRKTPWTAKELLK
jgi:mono/diheme cytochrome c family protein